MAWHGVAMVEFKVSADGTPYLMEVNARFWGSLQLAIDAGVDFPWLLYQLATGRDVESDDDYVTGVKSRWLWEISRDSARCSQAVNCRRGSDSPGECDPYFSSSISSTRIRVAKKPVGAT